MQKVAVSAFLSGGFRHSNKKIVHFYEVGRDSTVWRFNDKAVYGCS